MCRDLLLSSIAGYEAGIRIGEFLATRLSCARPRLQRHVHAHIGQDARGACRQPLLPFFRQAGIA